jgi:hypothetical protein
MENIHVKAVSMAGFAGFNGKGAAISTPRRRFVPIYEK